MISFYPAARSREEAASLRARADWYFRARMEAGEDVRIPVKPELDVSGLAYPFHLQNDADAPKSALSPVDAEELARSASSVVVWDRAEEMRIPGWLVPRAVKGDELCGQHASERLMRVTGALAPEPEHEERFRSFVGELKATGRPALILGSGPSLEQAAGRFEGPSINLYGGSSIDHDEVLAARPADVIALVDLASQSGPSLTAARRRERIFGLLRAGRARRVVVTVAHWQALRAWWPEDLHGHVIAIPEVPFRPCGVPFTERFAYQPTGNVLTAFLLPLAASFSSTIRTAGIDGAGGAASASNWSHTNENAYRAGLLEAVLAHGRAHTDNPGAYYAELEQRVAAEVTAYSRKGWDIAVPSVEGIAGDPAGIEKQDRRRAFLTQLFDVIERAERRPRAGVLGAAALGAILGGLSAMSTFILIVAGAGIMAAMALVYFSLRRRMSRMIAQMERNLATDEERRFMSLAARLSVLESQQGAGKPE